MAIVRWYDRPTSPRPLGLMEQWKQEMDRLFSDFTGRSVALPSRRRLPSSER